MRSPAEKGLHSVALLTCANTLSVLKSILKISNKYWLFLHKCPDTEIMRLISSLCLRHVKRGPWSCLRGTSEGCRGLCVALVDASDFREAAFILGYATGNRSHSSFQRPLGKWFTYQVVRSSNHFKFFPLFPVLLTSRFRACSYTSHPSSQPASRLNCSVLRLTSKCWSLHVRKVLCPWTSTGDPASCGSNCWELGSEQRKEIKVLKSHIISRSSKSLHYEH